MGTLVFEGISNDDEGMTVLAWTSTLAGCVLLSRACAWTLPVAGAYHHSVVTPTGKV